MRSKLRKNSLGLTLLEVMVALSIGAFMLVGILSLVASVSRARTDLDVTSEQIENGRFALQLINDELSLAGFYGQARFAGQTPTSPEPCKDSSDMGDLGFDESPLELPLPVRGYTATSSWPDCASNRVVGSEILVIHRVETNSVDAGSAVSGRPYLQISACDVDPTNQPIVFSKTPADFDLHTRDCITLAPLWLYTVKMLYLASCDDCSGSGDGIPTLKMVELVSGSIVVTPLVEGVSDIHYEYGLDFDEDGGPDCYAADVNSDTPATGCPAVGTNGWQTENRQNWAQVVSVRVNLLVRSVNTISGWTDDHTYDLGRASTVGPFGDGFRRQVYSTTVTLPNVGGVRE